MFEPAGCRCCSSTSRSVPTSRAIASGRSRSATARPAASATLAAPYFHRCHRAGRPAAAGRRRVRDRRRGTGSDRRAARPASTSARQPAGDHLLLRGRLPRRPGPHHRSARRVRLLEELRPRRQTRVAGTAARFELRRSDHAQAGQPRFRPARRGRRASGSTGESSTRATSSPALIPAAPGPRS